MSRLALAELQDALLFDKAGYLWPYHTMSTRPRATLLGVSRCRRRDAGGTEPMIGATSAESRRAAAG